MVTDIAAARPRRIGVTVLREEPFRDPVGRRNVEWRSWSHACFRAAGSTAAIAPRVTAAGGGPSDLSDVTRLPRPAVRELEEEASVYITVSDLTLCALVTPEIETPLRHALLSARMPDGRVRFTTVAR